MNYCSTCPSNEQKAWCARNGRCARDEAIAMIPGAVSDGLTKTLQERGSRYGSFADNAAISQDFKYTIANWDEVRVKQGRNRLPADAREALEMIAQKMARILNGDPTYPDNWHDIQGYAKLVEDRCQA